MPAPDWRGDAACRDLGTEVVLAFHDYDLDTGEPGERMLELAFPLCRQCPVRYECLEDAWEHRETGGMRALATPAMLRWLLRRNRRPRCSKCRARLELLDVVDHWQGQRSRCPGCRTEG